LRVSFDMSCSSSLLYDGRPSPPSCSSPRSLENMSVVQQSSGQVYLRDVLICQLAEFVMEVCLLLLKLVQSLLAFLELISHFDLHSARLVNLGRLLIKFFLDDLKLLFACLECLSSLLELIVDTC
jgi:hypothetical protein